MNSINAGTKISDVMTPLPLTVQRTETLEDAKKLMYQKEIRHLPVIDDSSVVGILTDRDLKLAYAVAADFGKAAELKVEDACIMEPFTVSPDAFLGEVLEVMLEKHIGSALIVDGNVPAGIFTLTDAAGLLNHILKDE